MWQTYLSQSRRTCWGPSVGLLQSGIAWDHSPGPPGLRSSESSQQHRPPSWTRWAVTAGTDAGNCRTAAAGSAGSWRTMEGNKSISLLMRKTAVMWLVFKETVTHWFHYVSVAVCQSSYDYWSVSLFLTFLKTSGALSFAQWSAGHCSGWRRGSLGAALAALSCERHTRRLKMTDRTQLIIFVFKNPINRLTLAVNLLVASAWARQTRCTSVSLSRSSWWNTHCQSATRHKDHTVSFPIWLQRFKQLHVPVLLTCKQIS